MTSSIPPTGLRAFFFGQDAEKGCHSRSRLRGHIGKERIHEEERRHGGSVWAGVIDNPFEPSLTF